MESKLLSGVLQTNTTVRLQVADDLLKYLLNDSNTLAGFEDVDQLVVGLLSWLGSSHFKVSINAMEIIVMLCEKDADLIKRHITDILSTLRERLGDLKEQVKVHATQVFIRLMDAELQPPQALLEEFLVPALGHKNWRVKEEGMHCLTQVLAKYGGQGLVLSKFVGTVCKLLEDPNPQVRTKAVDTLVAVYKTVGERVRTDLNKRGIPQARLGPILAKFDEALANGAVASEHTDSGLPQLSVTSDTANTAYGTLPRKKASANVQGATKSSLPPPRVTGSGGVDEMDFQNAFDNTPTVHISSMRELEKELTQVQTVLEDDRKPWDTRVQSLKRLRGILKGGALDYEEFHTRVKGLEVAMLTSVKDLRSQVCREACITLSYFAMHMKDSFELIAQSMLGRLILLLPNSAKVMSSSANTCIKYFIGHIHGHHLITPITQACESKSSLTRRFCAEYIDIIAHTWGPQNLDRQVQLLEKNIVKGISDADAQARQFMRRAFWGLYLYFPDRLEHIYQSFAPTVQRRLSEERETHNQPITSARKSAVSYGRKSALGATSEPDLVQAVLKDVSATDGSQSSLSSASSTSLAGRDPQLPPSKVKRTRTPPAYYGRRVAESHEGTQSARLGGAGRSGELPPSARPSSSLGVHSKKKGGSRLKPPALHMSRSVNPSPAQSRESSPPRYGGGIGALKPGGHRIPPPSPTAPTLTKEAMLQITSQFGSLTRSRDDEDETGSVGSAMSMSSEASFFSPYTKYRHPIQNVSELFQLSASQQWGERRDAVAQLQLLLEGERDLSAQERNLIKEIIRRMLVESHIKVYGVFLDVLNLYIAQYKEELEDWLFKILLRLLHKKGADMLSTVHKKLCNVLVQIRSTYSPANQLHVLCQIVVDKAQPMGIKTKVAWLEYFIALVDLLDPTDFANAPDTRQALSRIVSMCTEPKSAEIRKLGKRALIHLFQFNTAVLTRMIQGLPQQLQDTADTVLKSYTMSLASSSDESSDESPMSSPVKKTPPRNPETPKSKGASVSPLIQRKVGASSSSSGTPTARPLLRKGSGDVGISSTPASPMLRRSSDQIGSTPDMRRAKTPGSIGHTGIPTPQRFMRTSGTPRGGNRSRPTTPSSAARRMQRAKSTDPLGAYSTYRPSSAKSDYVPGYYMNGQDSLMSKYAMGRLTQLNYGDEDYDVDHIARALKQLTAAANNVELRVKALQLILSLAHTPERCNWEEHSSHVLHKLMELMQDESGEVKVLSLRVFREVIRAKPDVLKNVTELVITKIMKSCLDKEAQKTAAEDVMPVLAGAVDPVHALPMLVQTLASEEHPRVLAPMKMISLLLPRCSKEQVLGQMKDLMGSLLKLFGHSESTIRKSSVFCLVALHKVVKDEVEPYLESLTPSQRKLLDIYVKKSESSTSSSSTT